MSASVQAPAAVTAQTPPAGSVPEWLVWGPEPMADVADAFRQAPPAGLVEAAPAAGQAASGHTWRRFPVLESGQLDLLETGLEQQEQTFAWMHAYVRSPQAREVLLSVGSDDGIQVFVNGFEVHRNWTLRGWAADQDRFPVRLGAGWNRLLLRVGNNAGGFGGSARLLDATERSPLADLRFAADRPADYVPVETEPRLVLLGVSPAPTLERIPDGPLALVVEVEVRNLGTRPAAGVTLTAVSADGQTSALQTATVPTGGTHRIPLRLAAREAVTALAAGTDFTVRLDWGGVPTQSTGLRIPVQDLLRIVMADPPLEPSLTAHDFDIEGLQEDWRWGRMLRPDLFAEGGLWDDLLRALLAGDRNLFTGIWASMRQVVEEGAEVIRQQRIDFIGNAHIDMAWLWDRAETIEVVDHTFAQALRFMEEYPFFMYAQSQMQAYAWTDSLFPEMMADIDRRVAEGRWVPVGGMWVEPDCNVPSGEAFVRQILYGKGWVRDRWGIDIRVGWNPDSFGYAWTLPMIFKGAGIDYFITQKIGWNDTTVFPHRLFWWEAPDGSRVLSYFPFTYTDDVTPHTLAGRMGQQLRQQPGLEDMLDLYGVGDHGGGPTRAMLERYRGLTDMATFPTVTHTAPLDFMERVEARYQGEIPVWDDELYLEYHRGTLTTQGAVKRRNRRMESDLEAAEKFAVLATALANGYDWPAEELDGAWQRTLFNQFHDILPGSSIPEVYRDAHADYTEAERLVGGVLEGSLEALTTMVRTDRRRGVPVVVYNPLSWSRSQVVAVPLAEVPLYPESFRMVDEKGRPVPVQQTAEELLFLAAEVPGIGYRTFWIDKEASAPAEEEMPALVAEGSRLANDDLEAVLDSFTGQLRTLTHRPTGRSVLAAEGGNVLQVFGDIPSQYDAWNIGYTGEEWTVTETPQVEVLERGPLRGRVRVTRTWGNSRFVQDYVVTAGRPLLEVHTVADWDESHKLLKAAFFLDFEAEEAVYEIPYGAIARTTRPQTEAERAKWEVPGQRWVDVSDRDGSFGVTLVNDAKYGYDVRENRLRLTLLRAPKYPDPQADIGRHEFAYALIPHEGDWREADAWRRGAEYNLPLQIRVVDRHRGELPPGGLLVGLTPVEPEGPARGGLAGSGAGGGEAAVDAGHIALTALKYTRVPSRMPRWVVRLSETEGREGTVTLTFPFRIARAWEADLMEDPGAVLRPDRESLTVTVPAWGLKTLLIEPVLPGGR